MAPSQPESTSDPCGLWAHELWAWLVGQPAHCYPGIQGVEICEYKTLVFCVPLPSDFTSRKHELLLVIINCN